MDLIDETLKILNENTGVTLIISTLGFGGNEWIKARNEKKIGNLKFKADNIDIKTLEKEKELYQILSDFCLTDESTDDNYIKFYEKIRTHIIDNDLFLREELSLLGKEFADYIITEVPSGAKDLQKEENLLKKFKKIFRA